MTGVVKVKGIAFDFGGEVLVIPPLSLNAIDQLRARLQAFDGNVLAADQSALAIDAVHAALARNYPDITRERVGDLIGLENMVEAMAAVMDVSGLKRKAAEIAEGTPPGEV